MRAVARITSSSRTSLSKAASRTLVSKLTRTPIASTSSQEANTTVPHILTRVAKMSTESTQSQACCNTPAVTGGDYKEKGEWIQADGLKTCKQLFTLYIPMLTVLTRCNRLQGGKDRNSGRL